MTASKLEVTMIPGSCIEDLRGETASSVRRLGFASSDLVKQHLACHPAFPQDLGVQVHLSQQAVVPWFPQQCLT